MKKVLCCLALAACCAAGARAQRTTPPPAATQAPAPNAPAPNGPASEAKAAAGTDPSLTAAPPAEVLKAFVAVVGREPRRGELAAASVVQKGGAKFICQPPGQGRPDWDCVTPIKGWLYDTAEGRDVCTRVHINAERAVYGIFDQTPLQALVSGGQFKPCEPSKHPDGKVTAPTKYGYDELVTIHVGRLYAPPAPPSGPGAVAAQIFGEALGVPTPTPGSEMGNPLAHPAYSLDAVIRRAFQAALKRPAAEADVKALAPAFTQERATYVRMVEMIRALDSLKNIKP